MARSISTYAGETFASFSESPFQEVDSLILSFLCYGHFGECFPELRTERGLPVKDLYRLDRIDALFRNVFGGKHAPGLLRNMAGNPRFRDIRAFHFRKVLDLEHDCQFSAMVFALNPEESHPDTGKRKLFGRSGRKPEKLPLYYIAFRGTDDSVAGWKENMALAYRYPIEAQRLSLRYFEEFAAGHPGRYLLGGHSKGGNLAIYAAVKAEEKLQDRIEKVYSHDGPGFMEIFAEEKGLERVKEKVQKTIPQSSVVGMLLEENFPVQVVRSNSISLGQHDPFTWVLEENHFKTLEEVSPDAKTIDRHITAWLQGMDRQERERFVEIVFEVFKRMKLKSFLELQQGTLLYGRKILEHMEALPEGDKEFGRRKLRDLIFSG